MSAWNVAAAFAAGAASSIGPCTAPRMCAAAGFAATGSGIERVRRVTALAAGLVAGYVAIALVAGSLSLVAVHSRAVYAVVSAGMLVLGCAQLVSGGTRCRHSAASRRSGFGAPLLAGLGLSLVASPCCGPVAAAFAIAAASDATPYASAAVVAAYALGHCVPLAGIAVGTAWIERLLRAMPARVLSTVAGGVTVSTGAYYALLA